MLLGVCYDQEIIFFPVVAIGIFPDKDIGMRQSCKQAQTSANNLKLLQKKARCKVDGVVDSKIIGFNSIKPFFLFYVSAYRITYLDAKTLLSKV
jgi:hypothetical protein